MSVSSCLLKSYYPFDLQIFQKHFQKGEIVYEQPLSPTVVYKGLNLLNDQPVAIKELKKERLRYDYQHELARNELAIHYSLSSASEHVTKVLGYFESEEAYILVLEWSDEPSYFEELLEKVVFN